VIAVDFQMVRLAEAWRTALLGLAFGLAAGISATGSLWCGRWPRRAALLTYWCSSAVIRARTCTGAMPDDDAGMPEGVRPSRSSGLGDEEELLAVASPEQYVVLAYHVVQSFLRTVATSPESKCSFGKWVLGLLGDVIVVVGAL